MLITNVLLSMLLLTEPVNGSVDIYDDELIYYHDYETIDSFIVVYDDIMYYIYVKVLDDLQLLAAQPDNDNVFLFITKQHVYGKYQIRDAVGNLIITGEINDSKAHWNKRNRYGVVISAQTYLIIAKVKIDGKEKELRTLISIKDYY